MDIVSYHLVIFVFIVIIYLLFIKKDKVEDEDDILLHNDENNTYDTMLELKNKNDIFLFFMSKSLQYQQKLSFPFSKPESS